MALDTSPEAPAAVRTISRLLSDYIGKLGAVWIEGQVAQFRPRPGAKNQFLTLRDTDADVSVTVIADAVLVGSMNPPLEEGQRILVWARPEFWAGNGSLRLRARDMRAVGLGTLLAELARLRELLAAEGLFAPERKKPLPFLPHRVGLICGRASAAMDDVLVNARLRWPSVQFEVREVAVQGIQAVSAVSAALAELDALPEVDVIVIARGGGSVEDLLPFSNETLVRAVAQCRTPVVSAIGHEQDVPLIDFVADVRASTPTDAAKLIVPSFEDQQAIVTQLRARSLRSVQSRFDRADQGITDATKRMRTTIRHRLDSESQRLEQLLARTRALSPLSTLQRGYALVTTDNGTVVRASSEVHSGELLQVMVAEGSFSVSVETVKE
jgi:exodeoxyribonuclease VII large subunit